MSPPHHANNDAIFKVVMLPPCHQPLDQLRYHVRLTGNGAPDVDGDVGGNAARNGP